MARFRWTSLRRLFTWAKTPTTRRPPRFRPEMEPLEDIIAPTNLPPLAANLGTYDVLHGQMIAGIDLLGASSDPENDPLVVAIVDWPQHGSLSYNDDTQAYEYTAFDHTGEDFFTYLVNDGEFDSNVATVSFNLVNDAPTASNLGTFSLLHGGTSSGTLVGAFSDPNTPDLARLTVSINDWPQHGSLIFDGDTNSYEYTAYVAYTGADFFTYVVYDGEAYSEPATVDFSVFNNAPTASNLGTFSLLHGGTSSGTLVGAFSDPDTPDLARLTVSINDWPQHGSLIFDGDTNSYEYTAYVAYTGADFFTYVVYDGEAYSEPATVDFSVFNNAPTASNLGTFSLLHGGTSSGTLVGAFSDPDTPDLARLTVSINDWPQHGSLIFDGDTNSYEYTAYVAYTGADFFTYVVYDGEAYSEPATVDFSVFNNAPTASNLGTFSLLHGGTSSGTLVGAFSDPDTPDLARLTVSINDWPQHGSLIFDGDTNTYEYTAYVGYTGADFFTYVVYDGEAYSNVATVSFLVNGPPTVTLSGPTSVDEGHVGTYTFTTSDPGVGTFTLLMYTASPDATLSNLIFDSATGAGSFKVTFLDGPNTTVVSVQVEDSDGNASNLSQISVDVANVAPTVTLIGSGIANEGQITTYTFTTSDPGQDTFSLVDITAGPDAVVSDSVFDPATGTGSFDVTFLDGPNSTVLSVQVEDSDGAAGILRSMIG